MIKRLIKAIFYFKKYTMNKIFRRVLIVVLLILPFIVNAQKRGVYKGNSFRCSVVCTLSFL